MDRKALFVLVLAWAFYLGVLLSGPVACSTVRDAQRIDEMSDTEYAAWTKRATGQIAAVVSVAVAEGEVTADQVEHVAAWLDAPGVPLSLLPSDGYAGVALTLALSELEAELYARGLLSYDGGPVSERGRVFMSALSAALRASVPATE